MTNIAEVHLLVHPDYHALRYSGVRNNLYPLQIGLRMAWNQRVNEIARRDDAVLVYISALNRQEITKPPSELSGIKADEVRRINKYRKIMGDRFILSPDNKGITQETILGVFEENGLIIDPDIKLFAFGEYQEICVKTVGENVKDALGLSDRRFFIDPRLSLAYRDFDQSNNSIRPRKES